MTPRTNQFNLERLREGLLPFRLHYFPRLNSTSDHAIVMRDQGRLFAPAVVLTSKQTRGRGRGQSQWHSPPGVLTVTFCVSPSKTMPPQLVPLVAGLCVIDAARAMGAIDLQLKWPNDCWRWTDGKPHKVAGVLCERRDNLDFIGIGLNVHLNGGDLSGRTRVAPAGLSDGVPPPDMTGVLLALSKAIQRRLLREDSPTVQRVIQEFAQVDALMGRRVCVTVGPGAVIEGTAGGIDSQGRLRVVDHAGQLHRLISGTVELTN